ncbi:sensor histidine kinase [Azotobacter sp. CWF10]
MGAAAAAGKGLQFYACIDADVPPVVCGDAARIRQILNNLISNALKFTDSGRVVVRVSARWQEQRCWLQWQVADTGIGIASEHQAHLFEPFYTVPTRAPMRCAAPAWAFPSARILWR